MTSRQVVIDESLSLTLGKFLEDREGLSELLTAIEALAIDPRPAGSVPWGPVMARLHVGPYRVLYEIGETVIWVRGADRVR